MIRVVIDTNLWISFLIGKCVAHMVQVLSDRRVEIIATTLLLEEIEEVMMRPKFRSFFSQEKAQGVLTWLQRHATMVELTSPIPNRCRDIKDDYLLELAVKSEAWYLVSGDKDLLDLEKVSQCRILTFSQFCLELESVIENNGNPIK